MSNSKKQKPQAWRMSPVPPPAAKTEQSAADSNAQQKPNEPHRVVWRGVETTTEAADAVRTSSKTDQKTTAPTMWRGHQVNGAAPAAVVSPVVADAQARFAAQASPAVPAAIEQSSGSELTSATSLDDLFKAILGDQARDVDDRALLLETVEAQVRGIRDELGLPEPVIEVPKPAPAPVVAQTETVSDRTLGSFEANASTKRTPGLFKMVAGLALGRFSHS